MGLPIGGGFSPEGPPDSSGFDIWGWVVSIVNWVIGVVVALFNFLIQVIINIINALVTIFKTIGKFLLHVWQNYIKKGISWLASHVHKLRAWLKRTLKPVIEWFQKVKKWYDEHILAQQLRLLKQLQIIRRILGILRVFHIKWASALDNALADIQNRIEKSIAITRGVLNQIINTLALVLDPVSLITRPVLGGTLLKNLGALKRIFAWGWDRPLSAKELEVQTQNAGRYHTSTANDHISTLAFSGLTDYNKSEVTASRKGIADAIGASLPF